MIEKEYVTKAVEETWRLAAAMGKSAFSGAVITLTGDLGAGKTAFVQGLARGIGVPEEYYVTSPTYNIINEYPGRFTLYHADLYRIADPDELEEIGFFEIPGEGGVLAVEWPERLTEGQLSVDLSIHLEPLGDTGRTITVIAYGLEAVNLISSLDHFLMNRSKLPVVDDPV